jgi:aminoglycoside phosphotransferase (APT) family kinase protein
MMSPTSGPAGIDPVKVSGWLTTLDRDARLPIKFARIGDGKSNLTFEAQDADGRRWVLRRPPLGELAESAHDVIREQNILRRLAGSAVPVPLILGVSQDQQVCEAPLVAMEHIDGIVLGDESAASRLSMSARYNVGIELASKLAAVHRVELEATGLDGLASHKPYAPRQLKRWLRQWHATKTRELPLVDSLAERMLRHAPDQRRLALVHGDYHLRNVIVDAANGRINAVLDWELSTLGDPLADLGTLLAYWPQPDDDPQAGTNDVPLLPGFASRQELVAAYARASGESTDDVLYWQTLGYWKIAIICEGVRRRGLDQPLNASPASTAVVDELLARAEQTAQQAGMPTA